MNYHPPCDQCDLVWCDEENTLKVWCPEPPERHSDDNFDTDKKEPL